MHFKYLISVIRINFGFACNLSKHNTTNFKNLLRELNFLLYHQLAVSAGYFFGDFWCYY